MPTLPTNRSTNNTAIEHVSDHNVVAGFNNTHPTDVAAHSGTYAPFSETASRVTGDALKALPLAGFTIYDNFPTVGALAATPLGRTWTKATGDAGATVADIAVDQVGRLSKASGSSAYVWLNDVDHVPPGMTVMEFECDAGSTDNSAVVLILSPLTGTEPFGVGVGIATNSVHVVFTPVAWNAGLYIDPTLTSYGNGTYTALTPGVRYRVAIQRISHTTFLVYDPQGGVHRVTAPLLPTYWGKTAAWQLYQPTGTFATDRRFHMFSLGALGQYPNDPAIADEIIVPAANLTPVLGAPAASAVGKMGGWSLRDANNDVIGTHLKLPSHWTTFNLYANLVPQGATGGNVYVRGDYRFYDLTSNINDAITNLTSVAQPMGSTAFVGSEVTLGTNIAIADVTKRLFARIIRIGGDALDTYADTVFVMELRLARNT